VESRQVKVRCRNVENLGNDEVNRGLSRRKWPKGNSPPCIRNYAGIEQL